MLKNINMEEIENKELEEMLDASLDKTVSFLNNLSSKKTQELLNKRKKDIEYVESARTDKKYTIYDGVKKELNGTSNAGASTARTKITTTTQGADFNIGIYVNKRE